MHITWSAGQGLSWPHRRGRGHAGRRPNRWNAQLVASATTLLATALYASSRLLTHRRSIPPWKRSGKPGDQGADENGNQCGRNGGEGDAATVRACAATVIHTCITDISEPLWSGLEVHSDTWLPSALGGAATQQRMLAVIAPPHETEEFLRTLCGMGQHVERVGTFISFEPGWPTVIQLYPTLRCESPGASERRFAPCAMSLSSRDWCRVAGAPHYTPQAPSQSKSDLI